MKMNELLASIDMENTVRNNTNNSVIESEISEQVTDENTEPRPTSSNKQKNNQRFVNMSSAEIDVFMTRAETKTPKKTETGLFEFLKVSLML